MSRLLVLFTGLLVAGCGSPGMPGRMTGPVEPGHPFGGRAERPVISMCPNGVCAQQCEGQSCRLSITTTGVNTAVKKPAKE